MISWFFIGVLPLVSVCHCGTEKTVDVRTYFEAQEKENTWWNRLRSNIYWFMIEKTRWLRQRETMSLEWIMTPTELKKLGFTPQGSNNPPALTNTIKDITWVYEHDDTIDAYRFAHAHYNGQTKTLTYEELRQARVEANKK